MAPYSGDIRRAWDNGIPSCYTAGAQQASFKAPLRHLGKNGLIGELGRNRSDLRQSYLGTWSAHLPQSPPISDYKGEKYFTQG
jgi:hypothetical protein